MPAARPDPVAGAASAERLDAVARAIGLARLFSDPGPVFAAFTPVAAADVPEPSRSLLDHTSHMTVAMEGKYGTPLGLGVVARARDSGSAAGEKPWYAREILLLSPQGQPVQYGIVRIDLTHVDAPTAAAIRAARIPIGRVLINAGMLRDVHDVSLLEIVPGPRLEALFGRLPQPGRTAPHTYGRVAEISLGGHPAVELLEIVVPPPAA
jgi:hypothetical protein